MSDSTVIYEYTLEQAIADGVLVEIFKNRWSVLSGGKPIVATAHLFNEVSLAALLEIWNEFVDWNTNVKKAYGKDSFLGQPFAPQTISCALQISPASLAPQ